MELDSEPGAGNAFACAWREAFGETPALGHILRREFQGNWTRFHGLPESKRYAETDTEHKTILSRANRLGAELFEDGESLWLVTGRSAGFVAESDDSGSQLKIARRFSIEGDDIVSRLNMVRAFSWVDLEEQTKIIFYAVRIIWKPFSLDWLFSDIAEFQTIALLFAEAGETVFAPYDGGFDVICLQPQKIRYLEAKFGLWMPESPDKL